MIKNIILIGFLFTVVLSAPFCSQFSQNTVNIYPVNDELYNLNLNEYFSGYNLTFSVNAQTPTDQAYVTQQWSNLTWTRNINTFFTIISFDYWINSNNTVTHLLLQRNNGKYLLHFGNSISFDQPPFWNNTAAVTIQADNCFGAVLINSKTALIDCELKNSTTNNFDNLFFTVNSEAPKAEPQTFSNWPQGLTQITNRKTVQQYVTIMDQNTSKTTTALYIFSTTPYNNYITPTTKSYNPKLSDSQTRSTTPVRDTNFESFIYVYEVLPFDVNQGQSGILKELPVLNSVSFSETHIPVVDIVSASPSGSEFVFLLTQDMLIGFKYLNPGVSQLIKMPINYNAYSLGILQIALQTTLAITSDNQVREISLTESGKLVETNVYKSETNLKSKTMQTSISIQYIAVTTQLRSIFFKRGTPSNRGFADTPLEIPFTYYFSQVSLLFNNFFYFVSDSASSSNRIQDPSILFGSIKDSSLFTVVATSQGPSSSVDCTLEINATSIDSYDYNVYPKKELPATFYSVANSENYAEIKLSEYFVGSFQTFDITFQNPIQPQGSEPVPVYNMHQQFLPAVANSINNAQVQIDVNTTLINNQINPVISQNFPDQLSEKVSFTYTWSDPLSDSIYYFYQLTDSKTLQVVQCYIDAINPRVHSCDQPKPMPFNDTVQNIAVLSIPKDQSSIFTLCFTSQDETQLIFYDIKTLKQVYDPIIFDSNVLESDVTDVDVFGNILYITQPLLSQILVYVYSDSASGNNPFQFLYQIDQNSVQTWSPFKDVSEWGPVAVHGHLNLPNLIFVELLNSLAIISTENLSAPSYVNFIKLNSPYGNPSYNRSIFVNPTNLVILQEKIIAISQGSQQFQTDFANYDTRNPYQLIERQIYTSESMPNCPLKATSSIGGTFYYTLSAGVDRIFIQKMGVSLLQSNYGLFIFEQIDVTGYSFVMSAATKNNNDYVFLANLRDNQTQLIFVPTSPSLQFGVNLNQAQDSFTVTVPFKLKNVPLQNGRVQEFNSQNVAMNTQTLITQNQAQNLNLTQDKKENFTQQFSPDNWFNGNVETYDFSTNDNATLTVTSQLSYLDLAATTSIQYLTQKIISLSYFEGLDFYSAVFENNIFYFLDTITFQLKSEAIQLGRNDSIYECKKAIAPGFYRGTKGNDSYAIVLCFEPSTGNYYFDAINVFNTSKRAFFYLPLINTEVNFVSFYGTNQAYVLNNPSYPVRGQQGYIVAYKLIFDEPDNQIAQLLYTFVPSRYTNSDFAISSFIISSTSYVGLPNAPSYVTQLFILDGFGKGILYMNFNSTFQPSEPVYDYGVFDVANWLVSPPQNAYVDQNTVYYRLKNLGYAVRGEQPIRIEYQFIVTTSNTGMYRIGLFFDLTDTTTMQRPITLKHLYQIYNNYGSMIVNSNDVHNYNSILAVQMIRSNDSLEYISLYKLNQSFFGNNNESVAISNIIGSIPLQQQYTNTSVNIQTLAPLTQFSESNQMKIITLDQNNKLSCVLYSNLTLLITNIKSKELSVAVKPNSLYLTPEDSTQNSINLYIQSIPTPTSSDDDNGDNFKTWLIVGASIMGGVLIIGVIIWFIRRQTIQKEHVQSDYESSLQDDSQLDKTFTE